MYKFLQQLTALWKRCPLRYKLLGIAAVLLLLVIIAATAFYLSVRWGAYGPLPSKEALRHIQNQRASSVYSADSVLIGKYYIQNRSHVPFRQIPDHLIEALIATEDARFYEHDGIDERSLMRVLVKTIMLGRDAGGGSTISQQLIKNLYPRKYHSLLSLPAHKLREMIAATRLEEIHSKQEILALYLNTVPFGENTYGIASGAYRFFNKKVAELQPEEAAVMVGMLKAPGYYNPRLHPERSKHRRNIVISQMAKYEYISKSAEDSLQELPLTLNYRHLDRDSKARYLTAHIRPLLEQKLKQYNKQHHTNYDLHEDGLNIYTSLHAKLQQHAVEALRSHLTALQEKFDQHRPGERFWQQHQDLLEEEIKKLPRYQQLKAKKLSHEAIMDSLSRPHKMHVYTSEGPEVMKWSTLDSLKHHLRLLHAGFLAMNPHNGHILAWVGGRNYSFFQYDHVTSRRQVGSTFKPFVYATALQDSIEPCRFFSNERKQFDSLDGWHPRNADGEYGGYYSMKGALTHSVNVVSVRMLMKTGIEKVIQLARDFGITHDIPEVPSIALGTAELSLREMVRAYGVFAAGGKRITPRLILRVEDAQGRVLFGSSLQDQQAERVYPRKYNQMMLEMLQSVVDSGTASGLRHQYGFSGDIAGKTGTTQDQTDGWFIGMTPRLVAGAWVGGNHTQVRFQNLRLGQGAHTALPVWAKFIKNIQEDPELRPLTEGNFPQPSPAVRHAMNCSLYKEELERNFWDKLFGREPDKVQKKQPKKKKKRKKGLFKGLKGLFKKKQKD